MPSLNFFDYPVINGHRVQIQDNDATPLFLNDLVQIQKGWGNICLVLATRKDIAHFLAMLFVRINDDDCFHGIYSPLPFLKT